MGAEEEGKWVYGPLSLEGGVYAVEVGVDGEAWVLTGLTVSVRAWLALRVTPSVGQRSGDGMVTLLPAQTWKSRLGPILIASTVCSALCPRRR